MKRYIFITSEGFTIPPHPNCTIRSNITVLGFAKAKNKTNAMDNFLKSNADWVLWGEYNLERIKILEIK